MRKTPRRLSKVFFFVHRAVGVLREVQESADGGIGGWVEEFAYGYFGQGMIVNPGNFARQDAGQAGLGKRDFAAEKARAAMDLEARRCPARSRWERKLVRWQWLEQ